jgi:branched-chain amino acid transport system permease protein
MGVAYTWDMLIVLCSMVLVLASLYFILQRTRFGKSIRAATQDSVGAQLVGVNVARTVTLAFFLAGALAGQVDSSTHSTLRTSVGIMRCG